MKKTSPPSSGSAEVVEEGKADPELRQHSGVRMVENSSSQPSQYYGPTLEGKREGKRGNGLRMVLCLSYSWGFLYL